MVLTAHESINDASSVLHFRSALRHTTDSSFTIFSYTLNTMAFDHSTYKCFAISTCMAIAEGLPPSQKEHCLDFYLKVVAFRTHYVLNFLHRYFDSSLYCPPNVFYLRNWQVTFLLYTLGVLFFRLTA